MKRRPFLSGDTMNSVYIDPLSEDLLGTEFLPDVTQRAKRPRYTNQFIRWTFDHNTHFYKTIIKGIPIIAGSKALAVR